MPTETVFSEYEVRKMGLNFPDAKGGEPKSFVCECIGSSEEELDVKTVTKNCRGVPAKERTRGTGAGTLKVSLHCPYELFHALYGMTSEGLKDGVWSYGQKCLHPVVCVTQMVFDEDDNVKYKAYPKCTVKSGMARKTENGADEVAEIEIEISVMPDSDGQGMYEALESELTDDGLKAEWLEKFTSELAKKVTA